MEGRHQRANEMEAIDAGDGQERDWRPPRPRPGMPGAGVVTMEEQSDGEYAFGPAAPLVAKWREVRTEAQDRPAGSRVDRATAAVRRWELEAAMLGSVSVWLEITHENCSNCDTTRCSGNSN